MKVKRKMKVYSGVADLPSGQADRTVTPGCLVLEGGAWRGLYTQGALDALMQAGINFQTVIGVSAGAMSGIGYMSGQIGWTARVNLSSRHDPKYCGTKVVRREHGVTGFDYLFDVLLPRYGTDGGRFFDPGRRYVAVATDCVTGRAAYFDRDRGNIRKAIQASATVPYVSSPVMINRIPFLDGGCSAKIPVNWALREGFDRIMIIRTRDKSFRASTRHPRREHRVNAVYHPYPKLQEALNRSSESYNQLLDKIDRLEEEGRVFVLAPSEPVKVARFEGNMEKLGNLYYLGYHDMQERLRDLRAYLAAHTGDITE